MKEFNINYEKIKHYLFTEVIQEEVSQVYEDIEKMLNLSMASIKDVFDALEEDKEIAIVNGTLYLIDNIHFALGELRVIRGKFGFVGEADASVYIAAESFGDAIDKDIVLVQIKHRERVYGEVVGVLKRKREYLLGTIESMKGKYVFSPYDLKIPNKIKYKSNNIQPIVNQRIIAKIINVKNAVIEVSLESVLGMKNEPGIDILSVLFEHDLETQFNNQVLDMAKHVPKVVHPDDLKGRLDHRDQYAITIDGEDAKDLDDAVFCERLNGGYRLYVHIADVSYYVDKDSAIDKTAFNRSSSIYMVDRVIPMLPESISNGICSLHPNVDRLTLTCQMDIDDQGEIYNAEIYPSVINSKRRMSYNEINDGDEFGEVTEMIETMLELSNILGKRRHQEGSIDFESSESHFLVDDKGRILDIEARTTGKAEKMIEHFMVSANESVAKYASYQELPILYRVHEKPDRDKMKDLSHTLLILGYRLKGNLSDIYPQELQRVLDFFEGKEESLVVSRLMLRSMQKARYDAKGLGHFGLALKDYSHFTAPIRRYADLTTHRNLRKYVFEHDFSAFDEDRTLVEEIAEHVSTKERDILEAEREVEKMKKAEYMEGKLGEVYEGIISGVNNFGIFVELPNTVEGVIPLTSLKDDFYTLDVKTHKLIGERTKKVYALGQGVKIAVDGINHLEHEVIFRLLNNKKKRGKKHAKYRKK